MAYDGNMSGYNAFLNNAARDIKRFSDGELNAIRGVLRMLVCQDGEVYDWQRRVGNHRGEMKFQLLNYTVYLGLDQTLESMFIDIEYTPGNWTNGYHICGFRPIREIWEPGKSQSVWKYDWDTGNFIMGDEYLAEIYFSTGDVEEIGEKQFFSEVRQLRKEKGLLEKWNGSEETLPSPRIMEAVNRIKQIDWKKTYSKKYSQIKLFHEFWERISRYIEYYNVHKLEDLIAILEGKTGKSNALMGYTHKVLSGITNKCNQMVCRWYLEWILLCELEEKKDQEKKMKQEKKDEQEKKEESLAQNPFEPLIYLFERGANFEQPEAELLHFYESRILNMDIPHHWKKQNLHDLNYEMLEAWDNNRNLFTMEGPKLGYADVKSAEDRIGRDILPDYVEFLMLYNGGHPERCNFYNPTTEFYDSVELFYGIKDRSCDLIWVCREYSLRMPKELMPIANVGGCQICICTEGENSGKIFIWDSEEEEPEVEQPGYENVYMLADSLLAFLEELK